MVDRFTLSNTTIRPPFDGADLKSVQALCEELIECVEQRKKKMDSKTASATADDIIDVLIDIKIDAENFVKKLGAENG